MKTLQELTEGITKPVPLAFIYKHLNKIKKDIVDKELSRGSVATIIRKNLEKKWDVDVVINQSTIVDQGRMNLNAFYSWENDNLEDDDPPFEVELFFNPKDRKITITKDGFNELVSAISQAMQHELLHQQQWRNRGFKKQRQFTRYTNDDIGIMAAQNYLGNDDEIGAFAKNISTDLRRKFKTKKEMVNFLKSTNKKDLIKISPNLFAYLTAFGFDTKNTVIKKLFKKILLFIDSEFT